MSPSVHTPVESARFFGSLGLNFIPKGGWTECLLASVAGADGNPSRWAADLANFLLETGANVVEVDGFGDERLIGELETAIAKTLGTAFPASYLIRSGNHGPYAGGILVRAVLGTAVSPVTREDGRTIGFHLEDDYAHHCYLGGITSDHHDLDGAVQTLEVLESIRSGLATVGMNFRDVLRTWFYLDDILAWYDGFNSARTAFLTEHDVFSRLMPASTGIGIANSTGGLTLAKAHACRSKSSNLQVRVADSPLQGSAYSYGSAFSRAVEISTPDGRTLHISGTASIAPSGETEHIGDVQSQIHRTMEVVEAILRHAGMDWSNAVRGIAYFSNAADQHLWEATRTAYHLPSNIELVVHADICRHDLLFELELEAVES